MTTNSKNVLKYLQSAGVGVKFTTNEIKDALGFKKPAAVIGSLRGMIKKNWVEFTEEDSTTDDGKPKIIKYYALTSDGASIDADAE